MTTKELEALLQGFKITYKMEIVMLADESRAWHRVNKDEWEEYPSDAT